jgi:hypothetical protein
MWTAAGPSPLELRLTATVKGDESVALAIVEVLRSRA